MQFSEDEANIICLYNRTAKQAALDASSRSAGPVSLPVQMNSPSP